MDAASAKRIKRNLVFFKENITQLSKVMDKLIETDSIRMEEKAEILAEKSLDTQCHILLELLMKRGGFDSLIEALKISGNGHVADKILQTDVCCRKGEKINKYLKHFGFGYYYMTLSSLQRF